MWIGGVEKSRSSICWTNDIDVFLGFFKIFKEFRYRKIFKLVVPISKVVLCQGTHRSCDFFHKYDCSNPCNFRDMIQKFPKNLGFNKFQNFEELNSVVGNCEGTLRGILPLNMTAEIVAVFEIRCFMGFFQIFSNNLDIKKISENLKFASLK